MCQHPLTRLRSHHPHPTPSLARSIERNRIEAKGASALATILLKTNITSLKCATAPECSLSCHRPHYHAYALPPFPLHLARSLGVNRIEDKGASALAAVLKKTRITNLKCAAAPYRRPRVSAPIDTPTLSPSRPHPSLAVWSGTASETRAPLRSPPSSRRRRSPTWSAPPPECLLLCQCPLTRLHSHCRNPSLAVWGPTASESRAPPRSLPSSRRRW